MSSIYLGKELDKSVSHISVPYGVDSLGWEKIKLWDVLWPRERLVVTGVNWGTVYANNGEVSGERAGECYLSISHT